MTYLTRVGGSILSSTLDHFCTLVWHAAKQVYIKPKIYPRSKKGVPAGLILVYRATCWLRLPEFRGLGGIFNIPFPPAPAGIRTSAFGTDFFFFGRRGWNHLGFSNR